MIYGRDEFATLPNTLNGAFLQKQLRVLASSIFAKQHHHNCGALHDLVPFVQFKSREKYPKRNVTFSKVAGFSLQLYLLKVTLLQGCFSRFLNCSHGTKSRNAPIIWQDPKYASVGFIKAGHCVEKVCIRSFSGPHFSAFGLNTERYRVSLRI